jgi:NADH:ubiquinone oxidoreductase subunit 5 (subunit L)/multisubunit Na+/H+ antiporter MnhA subunit
LGAQITGEFLNAPVKIAPLFGSVLAVCCVYIFSKRYILRRADRYKRTAFSSLYRFLLRKWQFDSVYNLLLNKPLLEAGYNGFRSIDKGLLEFVGPTFGGKLAIKVGFQFVSLQTGKVFDYATFMGVVLYIYTVQLEASCF